MKQESGEQIKTFPRSKTLHAPRTVINDESRSTEASTHTESFAVGEGKSRYQRRLISNHNSLDKTVITPCICLSGVRGRFVYISPSHRPVKKFLFR